MIPASVIRSLALRTFIVIAVASVANGQRPAQRPGSGPPRKGGYMIRTVSGEPNFRVTATNGCADEIRLVQHDGADHQPIRWYQIFYIFRGNKPVDIEELKEGYEVHIGRCNRFLRVSEDGEVKLMDRSDTASVFTLRNLRNAPGELRNRFVVFEVELKGRRGFFLTNPNTSTNPPANSKFVLRPGSDFLGNPRNVFKMIYNPGLVDYPSCVGEACGDVFIDSIEGRIYWTNRGNRTIFIQQNHRYFPISAGGRQSQVAGDWDTWQARYSPFIPPPPPRPKPPRPTPSEVCPGGPGIIITIGDINPGEQWVEATHAQTNATSRVRVEVGAAIFYLAALKTATSNVGIVSQIIPNSQSIRVCGRNHRFRINNATVTTRQF